MARFSGTQLEEDHEEDEGDEIVVTEGRGNSWQERWWKSGGGKIFPNKEEGEILEPDENDNIAFMYVDEPTPARVDHQIITTAVSRDSDDYNSNGRNGSVQNQESPWTNQSTYYDSTRNHSERQSNQIMWHHESRNNGFSAGSGFPQHALYPRDYHHDMTTTNRNEKVSPLKKYILVIVLAVLLQRYCPPPPPRQSHHFSTTNEINRQVQYDEHEIIHHSWGEYLFFSGQSALNSASRISYIVKYISFGIVKNTFEDCKDFIKIIFAYTRTKHIQHTCNSVHVIENNNQFERKKSKDIGSSEFLSKYVVGQTSAIKVISTALDAWSMESILTNNRKRKPLAFWLTGAEAVGKTETAKSIVNYLFHLCSDETQKWSKVLQIQAFDFSDDNIVQENYQPTGVGDVSKNPIHSSFLKSIIDHVDTFGSTGCVIFIRHMEDLPASLWVEFLKRMQKNKDLKWENVIFFLMSDIGTSKVNHALRSFDDITSIPYTQLQNSVRNEIDNRFEKHFKSANFINIVAPFFPLKYYDLKEIMRLKLNILSQQFAEKNWAQLHVEDEVISHFVGPNYVDYIEWGKRQSNHKTTSYIFSKHGAIQLDDGILLQTFQAKLARGFFDQPDKVAEVTYDASTDHLVIAWCDTGEENELINCRHAWRGRLD